MAPGHHHKHASKPGQVMALTLRYQHTHPEYRRSGKKQPGRIDVEERYHYIQGIANIFIKDKKILRIITEKSNVEDMERARAINEHLLKKHNGDYLKAKAELKKISAQFETAHTKAHFRDKGYMQHIADIEGISEKEFGEYMKNSAHMSANAIALVWSYFQLAELMI